MSERQIENGQAKNQDLRSGLRGSLMLHEVMPAGSQTTHQVDDLRPVCPDAKPCAK